MKVMLPGKINLSHNKIGALLGASTCRVISFERLRHIYLSDNVRRQSMTSKSGSLSYFEHGSN